ncbi:MAG: DNA mismatch repair endonuclease MutL [bacterium]
MNKILILDDTLVSKIAAGEVIERPASVAKELVENSIDAGARRISIEVKDGGKKLIKVTDDGCGMAPEDAKLSIQRHSTSKLRNINDLFSIRTLGFRGEAIPSIASVSKFELITSDGGPNGTKMIVEGGKLVSHEKEGCPAGTSVTVEELFFNTPARLKFQKSKSTELSHIIDIASKFVLSNPQISFKLKSDGQEALSSIGSGNLLEAIASVYGTDMAKVMLKIGDETCLSARQGSEMRGVKIHGYATQPVITKSDRYGESFFVNGRFVRNALLSRALEDAYRTLIPNGKYPVAVIFVEIDPAEVDVNVHPAKREVKFSRPDMAMKAITSAVSASLGQINAEAGSKQFDGTQFAAFDRWQPEMIKIFGEMTNDKYQMTNEIPITNEQMGALFQLNLTYIILAKGEDLIMIDQHAAHERIMYEKIKNNVISGIQTLLVPKTLEIEPKEFALISGNLKEISQLGFDIEAFGRNTVMVRGIPAALKIQNIDTAVSEILSELCSSFKIKSADERREAVWKMMACKSAVKAGDKLSYVEMESLIRELYSTSNPTTCPHGRPTLIKISKPDMEKMFGR